MEKKLPRYSILVTSILAACVIVLSCVLLALPGQFLNFYGNSESLFNYSGYESFFHIGYREGSNYLVDNFTGSVSAAGVISLILFALSITCFISSICVKGKSGLMPTLGGILLVIASILFFAMQGWFVIIYKMANGITVKWTTYVIGRFTFLVGLLNAYLGIKALKQEAKAPVSSKKTYSYLNKH